MNADPITVAEDLSATIRGWQWLQGVHNCKKGILKLVDSAKLCNRAFKIYPPQSAWQILDGYNILASSDRISLNFKFRSTVMKLLPAESKSRKKFKNSNSSEPVGVSQILFSIERKQGILNQMAWDKQSFELGKHWDPSKSSSSTKFHTSEIFRNMRGRCICIESQSRLDGKRNGELYQQNPVIQGNEERNVEIEEPVM